MKIKLIGYSEAFETSGAKRRGDMLTYINHEGKPIIVPWSSVIWTSAPLANERNTMISELKDYLKGHKDMIFTILFLALADSLFLDGALRTRISSILHKVTDRLEAKVDAKS